jgi:hypothetical protein
VIKCFRKKDGRQIKLQKILQQNDDFTFPPKVLFINFELAGLLTFLIFCGLPIRNADSGLFRITENTMQFLAQGLQLRG